MSANSKIENIYWPGDVLIPHNFDMHNEDFRQVSQITYYGPSGTQLINIDYDEECDDIYVRADRTYSIDAGNVLNIRHDGEDLFLYDITIGEILEYLIPGDFDVCVTWTENERPDYVLHERVFQAPLSKIEVYHVPFICDMSDADIMDAYEDGFNDALAQSDARHNAELDKAYNYGFEQGYTNGVSAGKYAKDCDCEFPSCCAICSEKPLGQNEIDNAFSYFEIHDETHNRNDAVMHALFPHHHTLDNCCGDCCGDCDRMRENDYHAYDDNGFYTYTDRLNSRFPDECCVNCDRTRINPYISNDDY